MKDPKMKAQLENTQEEVAAGVQGVTSGQKGQKRPRKAFFGGFCSIFVVRNTELTVCHPRTVNERSKTESTTREQPGRSRSRASGGYKWPERAEKA